MGKKWLIGLGFAFLVVGAIFLKFSIAFESLTHIRFGSDVQRLFYLFQEINHFEKVIPYPIVNYVDYPLAKEMPNLGFYSRGWHTFWVVMGKITQLDVIEIMNFMIVSLFLTGMCVLFLLAYSLTNRNLSASALVALLYLGGGHFFYPSPHNTAIFIVIPLLVLAILQFIKEGKLHQFALFLLFEMALNIIHSVYATVVLFLFLIFSFVSIRGESALSKKRIYKVALWMMILYGLAMFHYFSLVSPYNSGDVFTLIGEYSALSVLFKGNFSGFFLFPSFLFLVFLYVLWKNLRPSFVPNTFVQSSFIDSKIPRFGTFLSTIFLALVVFVLVKTDWAILGLGRLFKLNGDLADLHSLIPIILLLLIMTCFFSIRRLPKWMVFLCLPFVLMMLHVAIFLPMLPKSLLVKVSKLNIGTYVVVDLATPFLYVIGGIVLYEIFRGIPFYRKALFTIVIVVTLSKVAFLSVYGEPYNRVNNDKDFILAYLDVERHFDEGTTILSNFEYLRSLMYTPKESFFWSFDPEELKKITLDEYMIENEIQYFLYYPWVSGVFPATDWIKSLEENPSMSLIYTRNDVSLYRNNSF